MTAAGDAERPMRVDAASLRAFAVELLEAAGTAAPEAGMTADALVWADLRGRHPQGVLRIVNFAARLGKKLIASPAPLRWEEPAPGVHRLDGGNGLGPAVGTAAMRRAVSLASGQGIGMVTVRHSNLYGAAGYYCAMAAEEGYLALTCSNAVAKVAPYGGVTPVWGTNPFAFACPTASGAPVLIDFATSAIAGSNARAAGGTGQGLPQGVALDERGRPTTDPAAAASGTLLPDGPKGYALGLMVEILTGVLSGGAIGREVGSMYDSWDRPADTSHAFIAVRIDRLMSGNAFQERVGALLRTIAENSPREGTDGVRYPGELRGRLAGEYGRDGIPLPPETIGALERLAAELSVTLPWERAPIAAGGTRRG